MLYQKIDTAIASVKQDRPDKSGATVSLFADDDAYRAELAADCTRSGLRVIHSEPLAALLSRSSVDALGEFVVIRIGELTGTLSRRMTEIDRSASQTGKRLHVVCDPGVLAMLRGALRGLTTEVLTQPSRWERMFRLGAIRAEVRQKEGAR